MTEFVISNSTTLGKVSFDSSREISWVDNFTLFGGFLTAFISYLWLYRWGQRKHLGPKTWPIIGCYLEIQRNYHRLHDWVSDYMQKSPTATFSTEMFGQPMVWIGRPDNVEFILKTNFANFPKGELAISRVTKLLGSGIFASDGAVWKQHRKIASFEFSSRKLRDYSTDAYRHHALKLMEIIDTAALAQEEVEFQDLALRMTLDSICKIGFGVDYVSLSPELPDVAFGSAFDNATCLTMKRQFGLTWKLKRALDLGSEKQLREEVATLDKFTYSVISERREELRAIQAAGKKWERQDLLSRYMTTQDEDGEFLSDKVLRDVFLNFVIAGRDTSAITLSWFVYCLCCNPEVAEKCHRELTTVFAEELKTVPGRKFENFAELLTFHSLAKLHYLHAAITETLRIYPVVPKLGKFTMNDTVLPDGTFLKKGTWVTYHPYGMGRLETLWGSDAQQFRPERWIKDDVFQPESPFKFTSFQAGPRMCLGKDSAYLQMKMTAALLVAFFRFQLAPDHPVNYRVSLVMPLLHGIKITLSRR